MSEPGGCGEILAPQARGAAGSAARGRSGGAEETKAFFQALTRDRSRKPREQVSSWTPAHYPRPQRKRPWKGRSFPRRLTTHTYTPTCKYGRVRIHYLGKCLAYSGSPPRVLKCHLLSQARGHALPTTLCFAVCDKQPVHTHAHGHGNGTGVTWNVHDGMQHDVTCNML